MNGSNTTAGLIRRTVTGVDSDGNDVVTETQTAVPAIYSPGGSVEVLGGRDTVTTKPTVYLPTGTDVFALDAVIPKMALDVSGNPLLDGAGKFIGDRYEVDGEPAEWPGSPFSGWQGDYDVIVTLRRVTG